MKKKQRKRERQRLEQLRGLIEAQRRDRETDWQLTRTRAACQKKSRWTEDAR
jgi:hypothetical protein